MAGEGGSSLLFLSRELRQAAAEEALRLTDFVSGVAFARVLPLLELRLVPRWASDSGVQLLTKSM
jgi:hypothetical protein